jgi:uncharacterized protein (TIGR00251 family)
MKSAPVPPIEDLPISERAGGAAIHVRLTPKSSATKVHGVERHGNKLFLKVGVTAPPEDGKANAALLAAIAAWLDVPKSKVSLEAGQKSRMKSVFIAAEANRLRQKLAQLLAAFDAANRPRT